MNEQGTTTIYAPPTLVELGTFSEDTLGDGGEGDDAVSQLDEF